MLKMPGLIYDPHNGFALDGFSSDAAFATTRRSGSVSSAKSLGQKQAQIKDFCLVDLRTVTGLTCA